MIRVRSWLAGGMIALLGLVPMMVQAQDAAPITYNEEIIGVMTGDEFEFEYTFDGAEGDVVVIELRRTSLDDNFNSPLLILTGPDGDEVASTADAFLFGKAVIAARLPEAGTYTILATRQDGRTGDSEGEFVIELIQPPLLEVGAEPIEEQLDNDSNDQYYAVVNDQFFNLFYAQLGGNYAPLIAINAVETDGTLRVLAQMAGVELVGGVMGIEGDDDEIYIVSVSVDETEYFFSDVEAEYRIGLIGDEAVEEDAGI